MSIRVQLVSLPSVGFLYPALAFGVRAFTLGS
jgi:hypothetical protein